MTSVRLVSVLIGLLFFTLVPAPYASAQPRSSAELQRAKAQQLLIRGMTRAFIGDHESALQLYREALKHAPSEAALLAAVADSYDALGDATNALFYAQQAHDAAPMNASYGRRLAELLQDDGRFAEALDVQQALAERFPSDADVLLEVARLQTLLQRDAEARQTYLAALERTGDRLEVHRALLQVQMRLGDDAGVAESLQHLERLDPANAEWPRIRGEVLIRLERPEEALDALRRAQRLDPTNTETAVAFSLLYESLGDSARAAYQSDPGTAAALTPGEHIARAASLLERAPDDADAQTQAIGHLEAALAEVPASERALLLLGTLRYQRGEFAAAADLLARALDENPRDPQVWYRTASAYLQAGDARSAADVADEGLILFPGQLSLLRAAGYAAMELGRERAALRHFERVLDRMEELGLQDAESRATVLATLGLLHTRLDEPAEATRRYEEALAAAPDHALALNNFAYHLASQSTRLQEALRMARRAVELAPDQAAYMDTLGWVLFHLDRYEDARDWLERAIATDPANAAAHDHLGDVVQQLGDPAAARRHWQRALELRPNDPDLQRKVERAQN